MKDLITGIQQVGIGVENAEQSALLYKDLFGMNVKIFDDKSSASLMKQYTGDKIHDRHAIFTMNLSGGGGFEIWQFTSRSPAMQPEIHLGDIGIFAIKIKTTDINKAHCYYKSLFTLSTSEILSDPNNKSFFWVYDMLGNRFQIVECNDTYLPNEFICGGVCGAVIGVSNIEQSVAFYKNVLGIDNVIYEAVTCEKYFEKDQRLKKVLLQKNKNKNGAFADLLGDVLIELVEIDDSTPKKIYDNRYWGDCGFIHLCFDVIDMDILKERAEKHGFTFSVDSKESFKMENTAGRFCYIEDPDGTLIELVETHKIPVLKKIGWHIDLSKRKRNSPLPKWMIKMLGFSKV